jgi:adenylate cyclase
MSEDQGDLCVLLADVVSSSGLHERLGDAEASRALERCLNRMRRAVAALKGCVIKALGDELMAAFDSAEAAIDAAVEMQQRIHALPPVSGMALAIRVGVHFGRVLRQPGDLAGDTVSTALRLASMASAGQILTSAEVVNRLSPAQQQGSRPLNGMPDKGRDLPVRVFEVIWNRNDDHPAIAAARAPGVAAETRLWLRHGGQNVILGPDRPSASLGRDSGSDIVIRDSRASRSHGRIEYRRDMYVLVDQSTNGTYVTFSGEGEFAVKGEEAILRGRGHICFGHATGGRAGEMLEFEVLG